MSNPNDLPFWRKFYNKFPIFSHIILICVTCLALGIFAVFFLDIWTRHGDNATVPDVVNMSYNDAYKKLKSEGFKIEISDSIYDERYAPGTVMAVWPRPGAVVKAHRDIYLTIAAFETPLVEIRTPLRDISGVQAMEYLNNLNIKNVRVEHVVSQFPDLVISATYNGKEIQQGMKIPMDAMVILKVGIAPVIVENDSTFTDDTEYTEEIVEDYEPEAAYD